MCPVPLPLMLILPLPLVAEIVFPSILTLSISALPLTSRILATVRLLLILTLPPNCDVLLTFRVPEISTLSLISISPPLESRTRLPEVVSMVLSLVMAI